MTCKRVKGARPLGQSKIIVVINPSMVAYIGLGELDNVVYGRFKDFKRFTLESLKAARTSSQCKVLSSMDAVFLPCVTENGIE